MEGNLRNEKKRVVLLFPPGWSFMVGSPYLSLPLLSAFLKQNGIDVECRDLNNEISEHYGGYISDSEALDAVNNNYGAMNSLYFSQEDKFSEIAKKFNGSWNIRLGFSYDHVDPSCSDNVYRTLRKPSPFNSFYKKSVLPWIKKIDPILVAISLADIYQIVPTFQLIYLLRKSGYDGCIALGGNIISRLKDKMKLDWIFNLIDFLIYFQGEYPLLRLVNTLESGEDVSCVPALIWKMKGGKIIENIPLSKQDLNAFSFPDFDDFKLNNYWGANFLPLVHFRGCFYQKCPFCSIPYGWGNNGFAGYRKIELVFQDMKQLSNKYGLQRFQFVDEAFPAASASRLASLIRNEELTFEWEIFARFENKWADQDFLFHLFKGGLRKIHLGLEIFSTKNRSKLGKQDHALLAEKILFNTSKLGMKIHLFCMFGFPGTNVYDAEETIQFIIRNQDEIDTVDVNPFTLYKHTSPQHIIKKADFAKDWAIEFDYVREEDYLNSEDISILSESLENELWNTKPELLHPIYRIVSPWLAGKPES